MSDLLGEIEVVALDCQAGGSTPAYGDLLEIGWGTCTSAGLVGPVQRHWIVPRTERPIPWAVRDLTGWSEACLAGALDERAAWAALRAHVDPIATPAPAVIHFARFELAFLRDLGARVDPERPFPLDVVCLHAIATRLYPDLPRRSIRALAGYLGHSPELVRRCAGHVEATAFIWRALLPVLGEASIRTWGELKTWLAQPAPVARRTRRVYPLASERCRALPDRPGVYRFLRRSGDVLYVGKAASLKKRVTSHFKARGPANERGLELLTQVHDVSPTETPSLLEAALLETDEIKRLDPPYNVQLRSGERRAWFASRDLRRAAPAPDGEHRIGPLPSERALLPLAALIALVEGAAASPALRAAAVAVPPVFGPDERLFDEGFRGFRLDHLGGLEPIAAGRGALDRASRALWLARGRAEPEAATAEDAGPADWDLARVRRRLERSLVQTGLLVRRARILCLLAEASVVFRERDMPRARGLVISGGQILERCELPDGGAAVALAAWPARPPRTLPERQGSFDAAVYDRLRVLVTELRRVHDEGGDIALRIGAHTFADDRLARLMRAI